MGIIKVTGTTMNGGRSQSAKADQDLPQHAKRCRERVQYRKGYKIWVKSVRGARNRASHARKTLLKAKDIAGLIYIKNMRKARKGHGSGLAVSLRIP